MKTEIEIRKIIDELRLSIALARDPDWRSDDSPPRLNVLVDELEALLDELCASDGRLPGRLDGTGRLCLALYGRQARPRDYLGGSEARMLHDAADKLEAANTRGGAPCGS